MKILKFSTPTCGQCKVVSKILESKGLEFTEIDCTDDCNESLVSKYKVSHVPVVIVENEDGSIKRLNNIMEVKDWTAHV